jgi:serine protease
MKKSILFCCVALSSLAGLTIALSTLLAQASDVEVPDQGDLFYLYKGEKIYLKPLFDEIAVEFKPQSNSRRTLGDQPLYRQLAAKLNQGGVRGGGKEIEVRPVGTNYAIVKVSSGSRGAVRATVERVQAEPYVSESLPVLSRTDQSDTIVLTNEIIVSFQSDMPESEQKGILKAQNLELIRPLRFTKNRYLVKVKSATGTGVLTVANRLSQVTGIASASPNFLQVLPNQAAMKLGQAFMPPSNNSVKPEPIVSRSVIDSPYRSDLSPMLWHLDSRSRYSSKSRTDVHAPEAWANSNAGKGVVVAVLDNLIQWDHPNLKNSLYKVTKADKDFPGEESGWDFVENDSDTRISQKELGQLVPDFKQALQLSDNDILQAYGKAATNLKREYPNASKEQIVNFLRGAILQGDSLDSFHGTMTASVIAASPADGKGAVGVAPNAKILPVRVGGLGDGVNSVAVAEAVGYAVDRKVDVINMSFGFGLMPTPIMDEVIAEALAKDAKLVIVVAAGNENNDRPTFPSLVKGTLTVGATNLAGNRAPYSTYGNALDVVAPGGDLSPQGINNGILAATGIGAGGFLQGIDVSSARLGMLQDVQGNYTWTQGTSFAAPAVAGVVALMKGEDPDRKLSRDRIIAILKSTASREGLQVSTDDQKLYSFLKMKSKLALPGDSGVYFFGSGLVNAEAAVKEVKRSLK